ncbi:AraC family transcriptional regulator [Sphingomonas jatrophae]|uniref:AraC-type DNA-binding protein n=1 Tax=Sphingomonas jatrophae TaxID=1166337 RepID=A0A1I6M138_9SPHN|nr:AraC family transcriptional regulator [Sphingomonas jatrophae]SFS09405.1 AraC-type DNA-binding protein [Sphingomonas jatrophae]
MRHHAAVQSSLSDLLQSLRVQQVDAAFVEYGSGAGARLSAERGAFLHLLLSGSAVVRNPVTGESALLSEPGDYALVVSARSHLVCTADCAEPRASDFFRTRHEHDSPPTIRFGSGRQAARTLSGTFRFDAANPLVRTLPRMISVTKAAGGTLQAYPTAAGLAGNLHGPGATAIATALFDVLVLNAVRGIGMPMFRSGCFRPSEGELRVPMVLTLIDANLQRRWTVAALADEVGMSRSSFAAEFTAQVGQAPMAYVTERRMGLASRLLRSKALSVAEVAWQCGYDSPSSFSRIFRRRFGMSPAAWQTHANPRHDGRDDMHLHWAAFLGQDAPVLTSDD